MPELRIGVELAGLRMPIKQALHAAAESGVQGVEIEARGGLAPDTLSQTGVRQLRKMLADLQLAVAAVRFPARRAWRLPTGWTNESMPLRRRWNSPTDSGPTC